MAALNAELSRSNHRSLFPFEHLWTNSAREAALSSSQYGTVTATKRKFGSRLLTGTIRQREGGDTDRPLSPRAEVTQILYLLDRKNLNWRNIDADLFPAMNDKAPQDGAEQSDGWEFVQKIFQDSWTLAKENKEKVHRDALQRKWTAYGLKAVAVFGGIAIAAGLPETAAHLVGVAITIAISLDAMFSNHVKLVTATKADNAYKYLLRDVQNEHSTKLAPILILKKSNPTEAQRQLSELNTALKQRLDGESKTIEIAIDEADVKALTALSLDSDRQSRRGR